MDAAQLESGAGLACGRPQAGLGDGAGERRLRASWSAVEGARYAVDLLRDGQRDDDRSLTRATRTSFSWSSLAAGTYTVRACSVNEDGECGAWSAESDEVGID